MLVVVIEYGDERFMLVQAFNGFERAHARWVEAEFEMEEPNAFIPLTECLWWAVAIDQRMHTLDTTYRERRDADQNGRFLAGVTWARNRTGHDLTLILEARHGTELGRWVLGQGLLGATSALLWRGVDELPMGRGARPGEEPFGRDVYARHMAGRKATETMEAVRTWFHTGGVLPSWADAGL